MLLDRATRLLLKRALLPRLGGEIALLVLWGAVVALLEVLGRWYVSRWMEVGGVVILAATVGASAAWHKSRPIPTLTLLFRRIRGWFEPVRRFYRSVGVDFREQPPFPPRVPRLIPVLMASTFTALVVLTVFAGGLPDSIIGVLAKGSFVVYLIALTTLWSVLIFNSLVMLFLFLATIHDEFVERHEGHGRRPVLLEVACLIGAVALFVVAGVFLPAWVAPVLLGLLVVAGLAMLGWPGGAAGVVLLGNSTTDVAGVRRFDLRWMPAIELTTVGGLGGVFSLLASGSALYGAASATQMNATVSLGLVCVWAVCAGVMADAYLLAKFFWQGRNQDPRRPCPPVLCVLGPGAGAPDLQQYLRAPLQDAGWQVEFEPERVAATDVQVELVTTRDDSDVRWPKPVTASDLEDPECIRKLLRRDVVQKRRLLMRGLERLFKRAARREFHCGNGYWIGLQYWYVPGMTRDVEEEGYDFDEGAVVVEIIGPPFHRVFSRAVRHHYAVVMEALELDLLFVEDGVRFRGLARVLRILFELFDMHDGRMRAEERHFIGVTGIRVLIVDFGPGSPALSKDYPEPDYQEVGRGRILHIFKDREEHPERIEPSLDLTNLPVPMYGM